MLEPGETASGFTLPGTSLESYHGVTEYTLSAALTRRPAVLNFYLFDFYPACRMHVRGLQDRSWFDRDDGIAVYGISTDSVYSHRAFARGESLGFPPLSDSDGRVADSDGVLADEIGHHRGVPRRSVFVVDQSRTVRYAWSADAPSEQPVWAEVEPVLERLDRDATG